MNLNNISHADVRPWVLAKWYLQS